MEIHKSSVDRDEVPSATLYYKWDYGDFIKQM